MNLNYEEIFSFPIRALKLNRCDPAIKKDMKWTLRFLFFHGLFSVVFLLIMYNIIFFNLKNKDFDETCKNGVLSVVYIVVSFQDCILLWKQDSLLKLMTLMKKDYVQAKFLSISDQKVMLKYALNGKYVCKQWWLISCVACGVFPLKNIVLMTYHLIKGNPKLIPVYDLVYPGIIDANKENIYVYLALYAFMMYYGFYSMCTYTAFVPLGPSFMLHACGQLELVEKRIQHLFQNDGNDVEETLNEIVRQLQTIYSFIDEINLAFRVAYELTLRATTIILPITCYEVIESVNKGELPLEFLTFIIGGVLISSSPCYYSDLLMERGENIRLSIYMCGWESVYNPRVRSTIRIIILRALKPTAIRTLFRTVCLDAITDLFQQSYTIFNLMNAMWK